MVSQKVTVCPFYSSSASLHYLPFWDLLDATPDSSRTSRSPSGDAWTTTSARPRDDDGMVGSGIGLSWYVERTRGQQTVSRPSSTTGGVERKSKNRIGLRGGGLRALPICVYPEAVPYLSISRRNRQTRALDTRHFSYSSQRRRTSGAYVADWLGSKGPCVIARETAYGD
ncbi:hypothetical protein B0H34DRAFT_202618 [Crassisporium funariophilum]|nr:hypothetical protein B0H34DRAFT_202618 [Crassisporium funariophilum]